MSESTLGTAGESVRRLVERLAAPFDPREVKFKPQLIKGDRAVAVAYVDARVVQDRLDEVLGIDGWQDAYTPLEGGSILCKLSCRLGGDWITKMDVGSPSEQPDEGDRLKAAFSDALKRAAVKFGVGRYLYRLPAQWVDYDPDKRKFTRAPKLPAWAVPVVPEAKRKVSREARQRFERDIVRARDLVVLEALQRELLAEPGKLLLEEDKQPLRDLFNRRKKELAQGVPAAGEPGEG